MALTLSKLFMRTISQNPHENQTGVSLWTLEDIEKAQAKQKAQALEQQDVAEAVDEGIDEQDYWEDDIDERLLVELDL